MNVSLGGRRFPGPTLPGLVVWSTLPNASVPMPQAAVKSMVVEDALKSSMTNLPTNLSHSMTGLQDLQNRSFVMGPCKGKVWPVS